jgi:hypothetical protein
MMKKFSIPIIGATTGLAFLCGVALAATPGDARKDYEAAIKSMHQAEDQLSKAGEDQSGHKGKALEHLHRRGGRGPSRRQEQETVNAAGRPARR